MNKTLTLAIGSLVLAITVGVEAQTPPAAPAKAPAAAPAQAGSDKTAPLKLYSLNSETQADPFPPINPKNFTADSPSVSTVDSYLKTMLGFDQNRIWRVMAIQKTAALGVSKVTALISERSPNAKVLSAIFFITPDGKHLIAADSANVSPFGAEPFVATREILKARANGPALGSTSKDLMLVEFADLQCPHCKDAQVTMDKLAKDFPKARIVFENFPLAEIHPYAFQAATYGVCIAKQSPALFFNYVHAVYDTQGALLPETAEQTLKNAATKAGVDPAATAACAATEETKADVNASLALGSELGVDSTPMLSVNGRLISISAVPYETLRSLIVFQAGLDGVPGAAVSPEGSGVDLKAH